MDDPKFEQQKRKLSSLEAENEALKNRINEYREELHMKDSEIN